MYDFMEVDYTDYENLREAIKYWEDKAAAEATTAFMALDKPVTEQVQNYQQYTWKALQFSKALNDLYELAASEAPAKKSILKKLFKK